VPGVNLPAKLPETIANVAHKIIPLALPHNLIGASAQQMPILSPFNNNPYKLHNVQPKPTVVAPSMPNLGIASSKPYMDNTATKLQMQAQQHLANSINLAAAKAAAIAAAKNVSAQILQQQKETPSQASTRLAQSLNLTPNKIAISSNTPPSAATSQPSNVSNELSFKSAAVVAAEKEAEQKRLEEEMRKRRERIEKWRNEKKHKDSGKEALIIQSNASIEAKKVTI
jgi:hypothetical protein